MGRPEPGPTQPAEPTDSQTSDSQSLHTCVRFGKPPGPAHTRPGPRQPAPSQPPAGSHTGRRSSPGLRRTHLGATLRWRTARESEVATKTQRHQTGRYSKQESRSGCTPAHHQHARRPLATHRRHCSLPVLTPEATSSRNHLLTPFLTPVSTLFNLNIYSAVQMSSSKTVTVLLSSQNTQCSHRARVQAHIQQHRESQSSRWPAPGPAHLCASSS